MPISSNICIFVCFFVSDPGDQNCDRGQQRDPLRQGCAAALVPDEDCRVRKSSQLQQHFPGFLMSQSAGVCERRKHSTSPPGTLRSTSRTSPPAGETAWLLTPSFTDTGEPHLQTAAALYSTIITEKQSCSPTRTRATLLPLVPSRPDLIEFHKLTRSNATHNLQQAFNVAEQHLGLTKLLDPEGETELITAAGLKSF